MSQLDPTGVEHAVEDAPGDAVGQMSYEEISGLSNGDLGLAEPHDHLPAGVVREALAPEPPPFALSKPPAPLPLQAPPTIPIAKKAVSGCYAGSLGNFQIELRVDIDRSRPMKRISGDFFQTVGKTTTYYGSFTVDSPTVTVTATRIVARGLGRFTFGASAPTVQVTIPRVNFFQQQAAATLQFFSAANAPGASYHCPFASLHFRTVRVETDSVSDVAPPLFDTYNTGSLPSGGTGRAMSVVSAFAEAGVGMVPTAGNNVIDIADAGANTTWSDAELHASMQNHFSLWSDLQQWCVWQLVARQHDLGTGLYGIMFDQQGRQRQGCAVFHAGIGGSTAEQQRLQLYTYVHELGHCFNLMHSWQKSYASPPKADRPDALSWMNYPWHFPNGGAPGYWSNFDFRFDDEELIHLRHGFRNDVIMGGNDFIVGASLGRDVMADPIADESGLVLAISTHQRSFALGEPVVLELSLKATTTKGRRAHTWLHPNFGLVKVVISKPGGQVVAYEPMIDHLVGERQVMLGVEDEVRDSAYIGYGKGGFYFDQPGQYRVRAAYAALDGSQVLSDMLTIRVRYPVSADDDTLADLFLGEDQGALLYLKGSDNPSLRSGNDAFEVVLNRFRDHPLATYARLVKGVNAARTFKTVGALDGKPVSVRNAKPEETVPLLSDATRVNLLDPVSQSQMLSCLSACQSALGDDEGAMVTMRQGPPGGVGRNP